MIDEGYNFDKIKSNRISSQFFGFGDWGLGIGDSKFGIWCIALKRYYLAATCFKLLSICSNS